MHSLTVLVVYGIFSLGFCDEFKKILLNDVYSLTLLKNQHAAGRRSTIPQINCIGGSAVNDSYRPEAIQCKKIVNIGSRKWECSSEMDEKYKLGKVTVVCEGYDYPGDPYITEGSCGVEYHLEYRASAVMGFIIFVIICLALAGISQYMLYIVEKEKDAKNEREQREYGVGNRRNRFLGNRSSTNRSGGTYTSRSIGGTRFR